MAARVRKVLCDCKIWCIFAGLVTKSKDMKRKIIMFMLVAFAMCGCHNQASKSEKTAIETVENQVPDSNAIVNRVQEIYQAVFKEYNLEDSLRNLDKLEGDGAHAYRYEFSKNYCSSEWDSLLHQIDEIDSLNHQGELGFWEADFWIMGQDWHDLSISDLKVLSATPDKASVQFLLHNLGTTKPVALQLVMEDGLWKIDDFQDVEADMNWKKEMQDYVSQETKK